MQFETQPWANRLSSAMFCLCLGAVGAAQAQAPASFPSKPIEITVPWPTGGGTDLLARLVAQPLGTVLNQSVIVENRPGASGVIGSRYLSTRPNDGHSLLMMNDTYAITAAITKSIPFDPKKDIDAVIIVAYAPQLLVTSSQSPYQSFADVVKAAKAKGAKLSYGACGAGTPGHLAAESLNIKFDMQILHIPYKGCGPTLVDLIGGQLDLAWVTLSSAVPHVKSGKLKALAVSSKDRSPIFPDVPTVAESGAPDFHFSSWQGFGVPGGTPESVKAQLHAAISKVMKAEAIQKRLLELGYSPADLSEAPADFQKTVDQDIDRFTKLAQQINLTMD
ncbi:Tripartite tricarboxylate transporter family receptor [Pigmentiphaga humi]|uniref:Tripartite tricarboxylate transporter family receptor n=1 Tax=Pigmentiphaga humi TaxID=2478468 RepID=A0A3P4B5G6_9BURK|nr:tripartite tricarboxylate transporter substrate binding protein [Pigmentiphaga humi]VCU70898.1 Tripartite tricarboxylate transporter family receptor [Pigmentiphaga humi]